MLLQSFNLPDNHNVIYNHVLCSCRLSSLGVTGVVGDEGGELGDDVACDWN